MFFLKAIREKKGFTQEELAAVLPNTSNSDISRFESGLIVPTRAILAGLLQALECKSSDICERSELDYSGFFRTDKKRKENYKFTVRLPRKMKRELLKMVRLGGYHTIGEWLGKCIRDLEAEIASKELKEGGAV